MGVKLISDDKNTIIYRKDKVSKNGNPYTTYCIKVSKHSEDGSWASAFMNVRFKKGVEVNNKAVIKIKNSFPIVDEYNKTVAWMIMDFDVVEVGEIAVASSGTINADDFMTITDEDLEEMPFA